MLHKERCNRNRSAAVSHSVSPWQAVCVSLMSFSIRFSLFCLSTHQRTILWSALFHVPQPFTLKTLHQSQICLVPCQQTRYYCVTSRATRLIWQTWIEGENCRHSCAFILLITTLYLPTHVHVLCHVVSAHLYKYLTLLFIILHFLRDFLLRCHVTLISFLHKMLGTHTTIFRYKVNMGEISHIFKTSWNYH